MPPPTIKVEEWIRAKCSLTGLKRVQRFLSEEGLYPPTKTFGFGVWSPLTDGIYRIHHDSHKVQYLESIARSSVQAIGMLIFNESDPEKGERRFVSAIEKDSLIHQYYEQINRIKVKFKRDEFGHVGVQDGAFPLLGAALFWYMTMIALLRVANKALKNKKWHPRRCLNLDEAIATYVASYLATKDEYVKYALDPEAAKEVQKIMESLRLE